MRIRMIQTGGGTVEDIVEKALALSAVESDVVILPEMFICGFDDPDHIASVAIPVSELEGNGFFDPFRGLVADHGYHLILGSLPLRDRGRLFNASLVFSPDGTLLCRYHKRNLFPLMNEARVFSFDPPESVYSQGRFTLKNGEKEFLALVRICYDLRFPEIFREVERGVYPEIIFLPMQWPAPRSEVMRTLSRSRAIENQAFVVACNRVGRDRVNRFEGGSLVVAPNGKVIAEMDDGEGCLDVVVDPQESRDHRLRYPFLKNFSSDHSDQKELKINSKSKAHR